MRPQTGLKDALQDDRCPQILTLWGRQWILTYLGLHEDADTFAESHGEASSDDPNCKGNDELCEGVTRVPVSRGRMGG